MCYMYVYIYIHTYIHIPPGHLWSNKSPQTKKTGSQIWLKLHFLRFRCSCHVSPAPSPSPAPQRQKQGGQ